MDVLSDIISSFACEDLTIEECQEYLDLPQDSTTRGSADIVVVPNVDASVIGDALKSLSTIDLGKNIEQ
jgi:hypothetical protein